MGCCPSPAAAACRQAARPAGRAARASRTTSTRPLPQFRDAQLLEQATAGAVHLRVTTNEKADTPLPYLPAFPHPTSTEGRSTYACIFNLLFKPSPALRAAFEEQQRQMFGRALGPGEGYAAVHLRLGKLTGEEHPVSPLLYGDYTEDSLTQVGAGSCPAPPRGWPRWSWLGACSLIARRRASCAWASCRQRMHRYRVGKDVGELQAAHASFLVGRDVPP
jgi:hypothetical protein